MKIPGHPNSCERSIGSGMPFSVSRGPPNIRFIPMMSSDPIGRIGRHSSPLGHDRRSRNNLPQQLTRFIGRQREIATVRSLVSQTRLTTLCGAGGIGKTRLALEVAHDSLDEYADGVWLVEFASISDPQLIPQTVASALNLREERGRSITDAVASYLKSRNLLLVLDNCEHVIGAVAQLADILLRNCPNLRILATSRESLAIAGETLFRVPPLSLPDTATEPEAASLGKHEAVELFVERVRAVKATFAALNESNAALVAKVCIHLEGIPLAIELAASRIKVLSVEQIAGLLGERLKLLRGGSRTHCRDTRPCSLLSTGATTCCLRRRRPFSVDWRYFQAVGRSRQQSTSALANRSTRITSWSCFPG